MSVVLDAVDVCTQHAVSYAHRVDDPGLTQLELPHRTAPARATRALPLQPNESFWSYGAKRVRGALAVSAVVYKQSMHAL